MKPITLATTILAASIALDAMAAASPETRFAAMKKAVYARTNNKAATETFVKDGGLEGRLWLVEGNKLTELVDYTVFEVKKEGKDPGKPKAMRIKETPMTLDLNVKAYASITFGKSQNELLLVPKSKPSTRYVMQVDAKTHLPTQVAMQNNKAGRWETAKTSKVTLIPYSGG